MIPIRLQLENFMSYGKKVPPLELAGLRLACLSGDNGNGKTALLDAMTWALFGQTRASNEDDVIRLGATDCTVIFDFNVGDVQYRVRKQRSKRGGANSGTIWDLQIWQEDNSLRSLSGGRETKAKIEQLLRMDYKTFLATSYLAQGRADEFARASVAERKKVLADILDLSRYERLEQMAKERMKDAEAAELDAERELRAIAAELDKEDYYAHQLELAQKRLAEFETEQNTLEQEQARIDTEIRRLEDLENRKQDLVARIAEAQEHNRSDSGEVSARESAIATAHEIVAQRNDTERAWAALIRVQERLPGLQARYNEIVPLYEQRRILEERVQKAHYKLESDRDRVEREIAGREQEGQDIARYESDIQNFTNEINVFTLQHGIEPEKRRIAIDKEREQNDSLFLQMKTTQETMKAEEKRVQKRLDALRGSDSPLCDYCGQQLPPEGRAKAIAEAEAEIARLRMDIKERAARGMEIKWHSDELKKQAEQVEVDLRAVVKLETQRDRTSQELSRLVERSKALPEMHTKLQELNQQIATRNYETDAQAELQQITAQTEQGETVRLELEAAQAEEKRFKDATLRMSQLKQALELLEVDPPRLTELRGRIAKRQGQIERAQATIQEFSAQIVGLPALRSEQSGLVSRLQEMKQHVQSLNLEIAQFTASLERCTALKEQQTKRLNERQTAAHNKESYRELTAAFGKKGVQALIIENALPEITNEANRLLSTMTQGAMQLQLLTQKERKTKAEQGMIETLEIEITDDLGTRPYEMFSGGEAFRINFALRVALSRMLANRAGAPLQTLILDEGFGTQDPRGREAIADALNAASGEFALVLAITHIDELKERFPSRIEVVKGQDGSTFTVF